MFSTRSEQIQKDRRAELISYSGVSRSRSPFSNIGLLRFLLRQSKGLFIGLHMQLLFRHTGKLSLSDDQRPKGSRKDVITARTYHSYLGVNSNIDIF